MPLVRRRPERATFHRRVAVASVLVVWTGLQTLTMVVVAARGGTPADAFRFWATGIFTVCLGLAAWWACRWAHDARQVVVPPTHDDPDRLPRHRSFEPDHEPPSRW